MLHSTASRMRSSQVAAWSFAAVLVAVGPTTLRLVSVACAQGGPEFQVSNRRRATVCLAQAQAQKHAQTRATGLAGTIALFGGNIAVGNGATLQLKDALEGSNGVSGVFRPRFTAGARLEVGERWFGLALDGSTAMVESPVTMIKWGAAQSQRTIRYMETGVALLAMFRAPLPVAQPYAGLGPSALVTHADSEGGIRFTVGLLFVAGINLSISRRLFVLAEGRHSLLPKRYYSFNQFGMQDAPFPTMAATVSGSHSSIVFGLGLRLPDR